MRCVALGWRDESRGTVWWGDLLRGQAWRVPERKPSALGRPAPQDLKEENLFSLPFLTSSPPLCRADLQRAKATLGILGKVS